MIPTMATKESGGDTANDPKFAARESPELGSRELGLRAGAGIQIFRLWLLSGNR